MTITGLVTYHFASMDHGPNVHCRLSPSVMTNDTVCTAAFETTPFETVVVSAVVVVGAVGGVVGGCEGGLTLERAARFLL